MEVLILQLLAVQQAEEVEAQVLRVAMVMVLSGFVLSLIKSAPQNKLQEDKRETEPLSSDGVIPIKIK